MIDFVKNILPRVLNYSKDLDEKEIFVEKPWIFIDESNNHHEYIFMRDGRLVMSLNGAVTIGSWELMPNKKLMINRLVDTIMLQKMFVNDALLLLQKSGTSEIPFTLINEKVIPDLDALGYLESLDNEKTLEINYTESKYKVLINKKGIAEARYQVMKDDLVGNQDDEIVNGTFRTNNKKFQEYINVNTGLVIDIYYLFEYKFNAEKILIKQVSFYAMQKNDIVVDFDKTNLPVNKTVSLMDTNKQLYNVIFNTEGKAISVKGNSDYILLGIWLFILFVALIFALIYLPHK